MAMINIGAGPASASYNKGNPRYILLLTIVATLGGLLFGYDTAVVNGAEKSLVEFYVSPILLPENYSTYTTAVVSQYTGFLTGSMA